MSDQTLDIAVAAPLDVWYSAFAVTIGEGSAAVVTTLVDDGTAPDDDGYDGIWHGRAVVPAADTAHVVITGTGLDGKVALFDGTVATPGDAAALAFVVKAGGASGTPTAVQADMAWPDGIPNVPSAVRLSAVGLGFAVLAGVVYLKLGGR